MPPTSRFMPYPLLRTWRREYSSRRKLRWNRAQKCLVARTRKMRDSDDAPVEIVFVEPLTVRISTAVKLTGISRSRIYELIESGDLDTVKVGRPTLLPFKSPKAQIGRASFRARVCQ